MVTFHSVVSVYILSDEHFNAAEFWLSACCIFTSSTVESYPLLMHDTTPVYVDDADLVPAPHIKFILSKACNAGLTSTLTDLKARQFRKINKEHKDFKVEKLNQSFTMDVKLSKLWNEAGIFGSVRSGYRSSIR